MSHVSAAPPPEAAADWTIAQGWEHYTRAEHDLWDHLFQRQAELLPGRAVPEFLAGLDILKMTMAASRISRCCRNG